MKTKNKSIIIMIINIILSIILWAFIWIITDIKVYEWKFWAVLFCIVGLILLNDLRK